MDNIEKILNDPVYQQIIKDSFGGVMYDVDDQDKYNATEIIALWDEMSPADKETAGGIMKGVFNFLKERG